MALKADMLKMYKFSHREALFGRLLGRHGSLWALLEAILRRLGALLDPHWGVLEASWVVWKPSWALLERFRAVSDRERFLGSGQGGRGARIY